ncbi:MAG: hypothetical protein IPO02_12025 [Bacteroidetes bacterium]|nr:hypothetical protein [Bacteroidota bacterium]
MKIFKFHSQHLINTSNEHKELHTQEKPVSSNFSFQKVNWVTTAIQILKSEKLKEHITKTPALLICVEGEVILKMKRNKRNTIIG